MPDKVRYARVKASGKLATPEHRKKAVAGTKKWRDKNPERHTAHMAATRVKLKTAVMAGYGSKCTCCGEPTLEFLTIEHLNGDGRAHRDQLGTQGVYRDIIRRGFPADYTVLCMNCNHARRFKKDCPHASGAPSRAGLVDDLVEALTRAGKILASSDTWSRDPVLAEIDAALAKAVTP